MTPSHRLEELASKDAIRDVLNLYCSAIDLIDASLLAAVFHPGAQLDYEGLFVGSAEEFCTSAPLYLRRVGATHHNITNVLIRLEADVAHSVAHGMALHGNIEMVPGQRSDFMAFIRYVDRFEYRSGHWRIAHRRVIHDWYQNLPCNTDWAGEFFGTLGRGRRDRTDPSYVVFEAADRGT